MAAALAQRSVQSRVLSVPERARLDGNGDYGFTLISGWVTRIAYTDRGLQIINYFVAGEQVALGSHALEAATACEIGKLEDRDCATAGYQEAMVLAERVVSLGQRDSRERVAHTLCEMAHRLKIAPSKRVEINTPFDQSEFGAIIGITVIHVNRTIKALREEGAIHRYQGVGKFVVDLIALQKIAHFDPEYLAA